MCKLAVGVLHPCLEGVGIVTDGHICLELLILLGLVIDVGGSPHPAVETHHPLGILVVKGDMEVRPFHIIVVDVEVNCVEGRNDLVSSGVGVPLVQTDSGKETVKVRAEGFAYIVKLFLEFVSLLFHHLDEVSAFFGRFQFLGVLIDLGVSLALGDESLAVGKVSLQLGLSPGHAAGSIHHIEDIVGELPGVVLTGKGIVVVNGGTELGSEAVVLNDDVKLFHGVVFLFVSFSTTKIALFFDTTKFFCTF